MKYLPLLLIFLVGCAAEEQPLMVYEYGHAVDTVRTLDPIHYPEVKQIISDGVITRTELHRIWNMAVSDDKAKQIVKIMEIINAKSP